MCKITFVLELKRTHLECNILFNNTWKKMSPGWINGNGWADRNTKWAKSRT